MEKHRNEKTPKEVAEHLGITVDTLRKWSDEFNIITNWTQSQNKGHRRYTLENINLLEQIREKINIQNWSWKQTRDWINGDGSTEILSNEEKLDLILSKQQELEKLIKYLLEENLELKQYVRLNYEQKQPKFALGGANPNATLEKNGKEGFLRIFRRYVLDKLF